jgi:hypothetical protein
LLIDSYLQLDCQSRSRRGITAQHTLIPAHSSQQPFSLFDNTTSAKQYYYSSFLPSATSPRSRLFSRGIAHSFRPSSLSSLIHPVILFVSDRRSSERDVNRLRQNDECTHTLFSSHSQTSRNDKSTDLAIYQNTMATYHTPLNTSSHPYPPPRADTIPASLMPGQTPSGYPAQDQTPTFSRPSPTDKTQAVLPRRSPSMSARAQREMMQWETYYEERGIAMPGLPHSGPSAAGDSYSQGHGRKPSSEQRSGGRTYLQRPARPQDDARLYNIDLERQIGRSRMDPSDGLMYPSGSSHGSKTRSPSPDTSRLHAQQSHRLDQPADLSRGESLSRRVSKRLSVLPWSGPAQHAPLSMEDEKRLEEERLERELEEKQLDEEEKEMLKKGLFNWSEMKSWRFWIRKEWWSEFTILRPLITQKISLS